MQRLTGYCRIVLKKWPLDEFVVVVVWCSFQDLLLLCVWCFFSLVAAAFLANKDVYYLGGCQSN